jgi:hypothetical protein
MSKEDKVTLLKVKFILANNGFYDQVDTYEVSNKKDHYYSDKTGIIYHGQLMNIVAPCDLLHPFSYMIYTWCLEPDQKNALEMVKSHLIKTFQNHKSQIDKLNSFIKPISENQSIQNGSLKLAQPNQNVLKVIRDFKENYRQSMTQFGYEASVAKRLGFDTEAKKLEDDRRWVRNFRDTLQEIEDLILKESNNTCDCNQLPEGQIAISSKAIVDPDWKDEGNTYG